MGTPCTLLRPGLTAYDDAWRLQQRLAADVRAGRDPTLILTEHPPTYTLGTRGNAEHLLLTHEQYVARGAEVQRTDRGGDVTFHGPGQLVGYPILDLRRFGQGPVSYVRNLEASLIDALATFGIGGHCEAGRPGVWVGTSKVAAIGVRVSRGVTTHGFALNVSTDLDYFRHIVPCGIADASVTSMEAMLGTGVSMPAVMDAVAGAFARQFGVDLVEARGDARDVREAAVAI